MTDPAIDAILDQLPKPVRDSVEFRWNGSGYTCCIYDAEHIGTNLAAHGRTKKLAALVAVTEWKRLRQEREIQREQCECSAG